MPRPDQEQTAGRFQQFEYTSPSSPRSRADYDCEPPPDVRAELIRPKRPQNLKPRPLPIRERFKWARCLAVVLCAVLGLLLLGRVLENLRSAPTVVPPAVSIPVPTPKPEQSTRPLESPHVAASTVSQQPLLPPAPRAQPVRPAVGDRAYLRMPDGSLVHATFRGYLSNAGQLPLHGGRLGDMYVIPPHAWVLSIPVGINRLSWVDP